MDAFRQFFTALPDDTGMAYVLIQHLDPTHESLTAELLSRHTSMSVLPATDALPVQPNHVYVIPPNCYLVIRNEKLYLTEPIQRRGVRVPIDYFLRSLADDQQDRAIGIILSGTGSDGTIGVREIKAVGGMVMVQAPQSAQFDGMPRSAIAAGAVDFVLPIEQIPETLVRYVNHWYINGASATDPGPESESRPVANTEADDLTRIVGILRARQKCDFSGYKKGTLIRRIERRMGLLHIHTMGEYIQVLRDDRDEVNSLHKDLLIGVTNFFREPDAWAALRKQVIEPLVSRYATSDSGSGIRVWSPGCATGEEPYSIAMLINETMRDADAACDINIFASDIDVDALAVARVGLYPETIIADVTADRLRRYFVRGEHTFRIKKEIREQVVFAEQNLISDPPFSKLDLICCRNLLIYLEPEIQNRIIALFHFALRPGGHLLLGNSETISQQRKLFQPISRKWRIYRRIESLRTERHNVPTQMTDVLPKRLTQMSETSDLHNRHLTSVAQQQMIRRFVPACVMVNAKGEILYLNGPVDEYLRLPAGGPSLELFATARPGLQTKLRAAFNKVIRDGKPLCI
ncbi:MAG: hypothetical protein HKN47_28965, partial [Pirellulaceae bacterium]|nr:hypothetical protein [Pirellulaceae bacterium]